MSIFILILIKITTAPPPQPKTISTKDDLALVHEPTHRRNHSNTSCDNHNLANLRAHGGRRGPTGKNRANKINTNRFSCGDFSFAFNHQEQFVENPPPFQQGKIVNRGCYTSLNFNNR